MGTAPFLSAGLNKEPSDCAQPASQDHAVAETPSSVFGDEKPDFAGEPQQRVLEGCGRVGRSRHDLGL